MKTMSRAILEETQLSGCLDYFKDGIYRDSIRMQRQSNLEATSPSGGSPHPPRNHGFVLSLNAPIQSGKKVSYTFSKRVTLGL